MYRRSAGWLLNGEETDGWREGGSAVGPGAQRGRRHFGLGVGVSRRAACSCGGLVSVLGTAGEKSVSKQVGRSLQSWGERVGQRGCVEVTALQSEMWTVYRSLEVPLAASWCYC